MKKIVSKLQDRLKMFPKFSLKKVLWSIVVFFAILGLLAPIVGQLLFAIFV